MEKMSPQLLKNQYRRILFFGTAMLVFLGFSSGCSATYLLGEELSGDDDTLSAYGSEEQRDSDSDDQYFDSNGSGGEATAGDDAADPSADRQESEDDDWENQEDEGTVFGESDDDETYPDAQDDDFAEEPGEQPDSEDVPRPNFGVGLGGSYGFGYACVDDGDCVECLDANKQVILSVCEERETAFCTERPLGASSCHQCFLGDGTIVFDDCLSGDLVGTQDQLINIDIEHPILNRETEDCVARLATGGRVELLTCGVTATTGVFETAEGRQCSTRTLPDGSDTQRCEDFTVSSFIACETVSDGDDFCNICTVDGDEHIACYTDADRNAGSTHLVNASNVAPLPLNAASGAQLNISQCSRILSARGELCTRCEDSTGQLLVESCTLQHIDGSCDTLDVEDASCTICHGEDGLPTRLECDADVEYTLTNGEVCVQRGDTNRCSQA